MTGRSTVTADIGTTYISSGGGGAVLYPVFDYPVVACGKQCDVKGSPIGSVHHYLRAEVRELIDIKDWDFRWQHVYRYVNPFWLPKGTTLSMQYTFDNSAENPRNPNHPPKRVVSGDRSVDEMGHVWLQVLPHGENQGGHQDHRDPRVALEEALMCRRLEKYPSDFVANFNLGGLLQMDGKHQEALGYFEKALAARPDSASARNNHATSLMVLGRLEEAVRELREVLVRDPGYASALYNLARALEAQGDAEPVR